MFSTFNNKSIRKIVVAFGSIFDQIYVNRKNDTTGVEENIKVPITFSSKEKFIKRLQSNSSITDKVKTQINLPYLSFEVSNISYDPSRKRNKLLTTTNNTVNSSGEIISSQKTFSETPIILGFNLYFYTRSLDEVFQILEQILPYFNPEFNIRINFNDVFKNVNVPISYREFRLIDDHEGSLANRRTIIGVMAFTVSSFVFGEIKNSLLIEEIDETIIIDDPTVEIPPDGSSTSSGGVTTSSSSIVINSNLGNTDYSLPSQNSTLLSHMTWEGNNLRDQQTEIKIIYVRDNASILSLTVDKTIESLTSAQITSFFNSACSYLNICGSTSSSRLEFKLIIKNNNLLSSKSFFVRGLNCIGALCV